MTSIIFDRIGAIGRITLNRPDVGNAIDIPMAETLMRTAIRCDEDDRIRCVLLTGTGRLFCVGGDVAGFAAAAEGLPAHIKEITAFVHAAILRFMRMPKPLIVAVNGPVAGAGLGLALMGDVVVADPAAHFTVAYTAIGMSPDAGTTWFLPKLVGMRKAQELCITNERVSAERGAAMGLITRVAAEGALAAETAALAETLAGSSTSALASTRRLLLEGTSSSLEAHLEAESRAIAAQARTIEGKEGIAAFMAKRPPDFTKGH